MLFKLMCQTNTSEDKELLYAAEHAELFDIGSGVHISTPDPIEGELEANALPDSDLPELPERILNTSFGTRHFLLSRVERLLSVDTPYLGQDWKKIRLFYADGVHRRTTTVLCGVDNGGAAYPESMLHERCRSCAPSFFCSKKNPESCSEEQYWDSFAQLHVAVRRITKLNMCGVEGVDRTVEDHRASIEGNRSPNPNDIIYAPLWLGVEAPVVNTERLRAWAKSSHAAQLEALRAPEVMASIYASKFDQFSDELSSSIVTHPLTHEWFNGFDKEIPELAEFFKLFPAKNMFILCVLAHNGGGRIPDDYFHRDMDRGQLGLRFYSYKTDKPRLSFKRIHPSYRKYYERNMGARGAVPERHMIGEAAFPNSLSGPHAWVADGQYAAHNVARLDVGEERAVFLLYGDMDLVKLAEILKVSKAKYKENIFTVADLDAYTTAR